MSASETKRQRIEAEYELLYHPSIPGRGEFIRLMFEAAGVNYTDPANENPPDESGLNGYAVVQAVCSPDSTSDEDSNPPAFAPPVLRHRGAGKSGNTLTIHQTPSIMIYLGSQLRLAGEDEAETCWVNQVMFTALDLNNETHDTHHPLAVMKYYEGRHSRSALRLVLDTNLCYADQKDAALEKSKDFRETRLPKFFSYFERVLKHNRSQGKGVYLVGSKLTYADITVWQVIDGLQFAFPKEMKARSEEFPLLFDTFYPDLKKQDWLKSYLESKKRLPYSMGVFRYYPELDRP